MPITISDHAPILVSTEGKFKKPLQNFKFENWWLMKEDFQPCAKSAWQSTAHRPFYARTNHLAGTLKEWCRKKKPINQELNLLEEQIKNIQMKPMQEQNHKLEASLMNRYEENLTKLTEFYSQRAKKHWATKGDRNTSYFHNAVIKRRRKNQIVSITDTNNVTHFNPEKIAHVFVDYFKQNFQTNNADHGRPYLRTQPDAHQQDPTTSIPDKQEIWQILNEMRRNASPGPDGLNVAFYIAAWEWIGDDVTDLVMQQEGEPQPRVIADNTKALLKQIWKAKDIAPRVQTFAWRLIRKALPTGKRAGKYSKHIDKECSRCSAEEDEQHIFFTCPYARAAWFAKPWYIRMDNFISNSTSIITIILNLLSSDHPHASLTNIFTFMWCLWKVRNEKLF
ncbi:uncharacterized protein [Triticum aestivum]|uniref:uncharacterized protein n=1 Tax=Triticum aestivum TaxID=4565 RepID=UPI001D02934B|nr:uncharacterized protein LOC123087194 [Triticum aestivum]